MVNRASLILWRALGRHWASALIIRSHTRISKTAFTAPTPEQGERPPQHCPHGLKQVSGPAPASQSCPRLVHPRPSQSGPVGRFGTLLATVERELCCWPVCRGPACRGPIDLAPATTTATRPLPCFFLGATRRVRESRSNHSMPLEHRKQRKLNIWQHRPSTQS